MPICPGCEQKVPYDRLDIHERYCEGLMAEDGSGNHASEQLERRLLALEERLDGRLKSLESKVERRLRGEEVERGRWTRRRE